jgi:hypothetical protein
MGRLGWNSGYIGSDQRIGTTGAVGLDKYYLERSAGRFYPTIGSLFLDIYPGASAAYSLRKLSSNYNGSAIRVRRSSDNTEQDIGFSNNQLDTSTLSLFCGAGSGFVTTWYDQSGNNINVTQSTSLNQPQIVASGNIINTNGKPAIDFSTSTAPVTLDGNLTSTNQYWTAVGVANYKTPPASSTYYYGRWISVGTPGTQDYNNTSSFLGFVTNQSGYSAPPPVAGACYNINTNESAIVYNTQYVLNVLKTGNTVKSGLNNVLSAGFTQAGTLNANRIRLGANVSWTPEVNSNLYGTIQEVIYYQTDQSALLSNINTNINLYYLTY